MTQQEQLEAIIENLHNSKDDILTKKKYAIPAITALIQEAVNEGRAEFVKILDEESHLFANNSHVGRVRASIKRRINK